MQPYLERIREALDERGHKAPAPTGLDPHTSCGSVILHHAQTTKNHLLKSLEYPTGQDTKLLVALRNQRRQSRPESLPGKVTRAIAALEGYDYVKTALTYDVSLAARVAAQIDELTYVATLREIYDALNALG